MKEKIMLRSKAKTLEPVVRIGKNGVTEGTVMEIGKVLEKRKLIKIKLLQPSMDKISKDELVKDILMKTRSELVEAVGNILVLYRR